MGFFDLMMGMVGGEAVQALLTEGPDLLAQLQVYLDKGTDPQDPGVQVAASRVFGLIQGATGKTIASQQDLQGLIEQYRPMLTSHLGENVPSPRMVSYLAKAGGIPSVPTTA